MNQVSIFHSSAPTDVGTQNASWSRSGALSITRGLISGHQAVVPISQFYELVPGGRTTASKQIIVHIEKLNDNSLKLRRPIAVKLNFDNDCVIASFEEAEIVTSGEFASEAIDWLKDTIASDFTLFSAERGALGPLPKRQLAALEKYIAKEQARKKRRAGHRS